jgi:hypothetical protein
MLKRYKTVKTLAFIKSDIEVLVKPPTASLREDRAGCELVHKLNSHSERETTARRFLDCLRLGTWRYHVPPKRRCLPIDMTSYSRRPEGSRRK